MEDKKTVTISDFDKSLLIYLDIESIIKNDSIKNKLSPEFIECLLKFKDIDATIFACYDFLDSPEKGILQNENTFKIKTVNL